MTLCSRLSKFSKMRIHFLCYASSGRRVACSLERSRLNRGVAQTGAPNCSTDLMYTLSNISRVHGLFHALLLTKFISQWKVLRPLVKTCFIMHFSEPYSSNTNPRYLKIFTTLKDIQPNCTLSRTSLLRYPHTRSSVFSSLIISSCYWQKV